MKEVLIIDDEPEIRHFLSYLLSQKGYRVTLCKSGRDFEQLLPELTADLAMIDVKLPDASGLDILKQLKQAMPHCITIIMTGYSTVKTAVEAIKLGANDYIEKPFDSIDELEALLDHLLNHHRTPYGHEIHLLADELGLMVGESKEMHQLLTLAYKIAGKNINVLIEGETGSGKDILAKFIHHASHRSKYPFIAINCGALSESLLESELFGHEKGAFTGAYKERKGVFEIADKGTLFLDEIAEASPTTQVKLLRTIETGEYMRIGDEALRRTNTRIIAASHADLAAAVKENTFREDLLYRLDVVKLTIPPLRERKQDIPLFLNHFLKMHNASLSFSDEAIEQLMKYAWPGNIRELSNVIKRAVTLAEDETVTITPHYLPEKIHVYSPVSAESPADTGEGSVLEPYLEQWTEEMLRLWKNEREIILDDVLLHVKELEVEVGKALVTKTIKETMGNRKAAAEKLKISTRQLRYLLSEKN